jgi:hypothetical protein
VTTWGSYATRQETMDEAWTGTLTIQNLRDMPTLMTGPVHALDSMSMGGIGCAAGIELYAHGDETDTADPGWPTEAQDEVDAYHVWRAALAAPPPPPPPPVNGSWWLFRFYVTAPGPDMDEHFICIGIANPGTGAQWYGGETYAAPLTMGVTNLVLKSRGGDSTPSDRNTRDFVDQHVQDAWHVTDTTVSSATMTVPASELGAKGDITASGSWGTMPGVGELTGDWPTTLQASYAISYGSNTEPDTVYATILPSWADVDLSLWALDDYSADGAAWTHWWDGADFRDPWPTGTPKFRVTGANDLIEASRVGGAASDAMAWTGTSGVPYLLKVDITSGRWDDAGGDWPTPISFVVADLLDAAGDPVYLGIGTSAQYTEARHSWYEENVLNPTVTADVLQAWADGAGEDVSSGTLTDLLAPIGVPDLTQSVSSAPWASGPLTIAQAAVNVHKPAGVSRPTLWVGAGGATITTQTDSLLEVLVAGGVAGQTIARIFTSRQQAQLDRLQPPNTDPDLAYKPDWPIMLKANLDPTIGGVIPAGDPLRAALEADEDVTNWDNFSYLKVQYTAPAGVTPAFTVTLFYNELYVTDPCYSGWQYRFGPDGEWNHVWFPGVIGSYSADYTGAAMDGAGAQTYYIDLRCPNEGDLPRGALQHVAAIAVSGLTAAAGDETWALDMTEWELCDGPVGSQHLALDFKRAWDWEGNFFGLAGWHDGAPILAIQYGFEQFEEQERGLKYQQYAQHNPGSGAVTDPITAKTLSRLADELSWQEGFTASWSTAAFRARFRDADGVDLFGDASAYPWWLYYNPDADLPLEVGATVRSWTIAPGADYTVHVRHHLQGRLHGLLKHSAGTHRLRNEAAAVEVYSAPEDDPDDQTLVGTYGSDEHGRWMSDPLPEKGFIYVVEVDGVQSAATVAVNRSWSWAYAKAGTAAGAIEMFTDPMGIQWQVWIEGGYIKVNHRTDDWTTWSTPVNVASGAASYDAVGIAGDGRVAWVSARHATSQKPYTWYSTNYGATWTGPVLTG